MNWAAVSAIAELIAAVAILITLVYLAFQIRQAKEQITLAGQRHRADAARHVLSSVSDSPYLAPILAKLGGLPWGDYGLDEAQDNVRLFMWCHAWMRTEEMNFRMSSPVQRATQDQLLRGWLSVPWAAQFWTQNRAIYDADFADRMDTLLDEVGLAEDKTAELFAERK
ncbi:MAG: hypothetical protein IIB76_08855 [Proteobacteria bacterium]|nr:hypothetical protein [Pseudomonadota bacterium]